MKDKIRGPFGFEIDGYATTDLRHMGFSFFVILCLLVVVGIIAAFAGVNTFYVALFMGMVIGAWFMDIYHRRRNEVLLLHEQ
jgi:hypothetical protein